MTLSQLSEAAQNKFKLAVREVNSCATWKVPEVSNLELAGKRVGMGKEEGVNQGY